MDDRLICIDSSVLACFSSSVEAHCCVLNNLKDTYSYDPEQVNSILLPHIGQSLQLVTSALAPGSPASERLAAAQSLTFLFGELFDFLLDNQVGHSALYEAGVRSL